MKTLRYTLATILCLIVVAFQMVTYLVFGLSKFINEDTINSFLKEINIVTVLNEVEKDKDNDETMLYEIYEEAKKIDIPKEMIDEIFNSDPFKKMVTTYMLESLSPTLSGEYINPVKDENIEKAILKNLDIYAENLGIRLSKEQKDKLINIYIAKKDIIFEKLYGSKVEKHFSKLNAKLANFLLGYYLKALLVVLTLTFSVFVALVLWSKYEWAIWLGISTICSGILSLVGVLLKRLILIDLEKKVSLATMEIINALSTTLAKSIVLYGIAAILIGTLILIIGFWMKKKLSTN